MAANGANKTGYPRAKVSMHCSGFCTGVRLVEHSVDIVLIVRSSKPVSTFKMHGRKEI